MRFDLKFYRVSFFGFAFAYVLYESYQYDNIFQILFYLTFGIIMVYNFYNNLFEKNGTFKKFSEIRISPTFLIGCLAIIVNIGIFAYYEVKLNAATLMKAENFGVVADFKTNGDYIIKSGSWGSKTHFYGNYQIKDSTILLDRNGFDDVLVSNQFMIRKRPNNFNGTNASKMYLVQIDKNRNEIRNFKTFEIKPTREIDISYTFDIIEHKLK